MKAIKVGFMTEDYGKRSWQGRGAYQPEDHSDDYGRFPLNTSEQNIVDAFIGRTKLIDLLKNLKEDEPELFNEVMEYIVLMNIKSPSGM